jgi:hypothetical protein
MRTPTTIALLAIAVVMLLPQTTLAHKAKKNAEVFIANLEDGDVVRSPLRIEFGARNIEIAPVGVNTHRSGHHQLLIDVAVPESMDDLIPFDENHLHYMNGETGTVIELSPGAHTLQLILGDEEHQPWGEHLMSKRITVYVIDDDPNPAPPAIIPDGH